MLSQLVVFTAAILCAFVEFRGVDARFDRIKRQSMTAMYGSAVPAALPQAGSPLSSSSVYNYNSYSNPYYGSYGNNGYYRGSSGSSGNAGNTRGGSQGLTLGGLSAGQMGVAADSISLGSNSVDAVAAAGK